MPPPGAPAGYGGFVPLEKLIELRPDVLVMSNALELPDGQGAVYLTHPALQSSIRMHRRIILPSRYTLCGGPSLIAAFDYLTEVVTRLAAEQSKLRGLRGPFGDDAGERIEAVGQRRRSRLQDERRFDLAQEAVAHRRDLCRSPDAPRPSPGTNFLPHQEPTMMSGCAAITSCGDTMRSLAFLRSDSSGNTSMPPATSINSATQRMPEIIGSSHSSK